MSKLLKVVAGVGIAAAVITTASACSSSGGGDSKPVVKVDKLSGNTTSVALDAGFVKALTSLKVAPGLVGTAKMNGTTVSFPITGGHVTVYKKGAVKPYVQGELDHQGSGLSLTAGGIKVELENFKVDPGNNSKLTGDVLANGKSVVKGAKLFDLDGSTLKTPSVDSSTGIATLTGTRVLLSSDAAGLLDKTFKTNAIKGGTLVGIATIAAK